MALNDSPKPKDESDPTKTYVSIPVASLFVGQKFPADVYLCVNHRMLKYKNQGEDLDTYLYDKLITGRVRYLFGEFKDHETFTTWLKKTEAVQNEVKTPQVEEIKTVVEVVKEQRRAVMDLFDNPKDNDNVKKSIAVSKKLVSEFLKKPYTAQNITAMQRYSKGVMDHAVNVSMLSVFLGLNMGYSSQVILEHLALGGLYHDVGKTQIERTEPNEDGFLGEEDPKMQDHPKLGKALLEGQKEVPNEVCMIVVQHHEYLDGTGYPMRLRGLAVYDLARIVTIANVYDNLISELFIGDIKDASSQALDRLEREFEGKFDPKKLEKAVKILRTALL